MPESFTSYRDLQVWQKSMLLAKDVYKATASFPTEERFGLVSQMRRSAVSVPSNLAEGHARTGPGEFSRFISIAMGSVAELETRVLLSTELGYWENAAQENLLRQLDAVGRMLRGLQKSISARKSTSNSKSQVSSP